MELKIVVQRIVRIPKNFYKQGDTSFYDLLKASGYFEKHKNISVQQIYSELKKNSELVKDWVTYSEDKRSGGWYIKFEQNNRYVVGFLGQKGNDVCSEYNDRIKACAIFIKHELDDIASH